MKTLALLVVCLACCAGSHAADFRYLGPNETLAAGDVISIVSLAPGASGQSLSGRAQGDDASEVFLAVAQPGGQSATRWQVIETAPGVYALQCLGVTDGRMWLDGHTLTGGVRLALSPNGVSGASWGVYREGTGVNLKCLGKARGARWLVVAPEQQVALAAEPEGLPALWQVQVWKKGSSINLAPHSDTKP